MENSSDSRRSTANIDLNESLINEPDLPTPETTPNSSQESQNSEPAINNNENPNKRGPPREYTIRAFFCITRRFKTFNSFAIALIHLDALYLGSQTIASLIGWLLTSSLELSFVSLTSFLFFGVVFLMYFGVLLGYYNPNYALASTSRLILIRIVLVYLWFILQIVVLSASFITLVWASPGGWGGRGQGTGRGDTQFRGITDVWRFIYFVFSLYGLVYLVSLFNGNKGILRVIKGRRVREAVENEREIGALRNYLEMIN